MGTVVLILLVAAVAGIVIHMLFFARDRVTLTFEKSAETLRNPVMGYAPEATYVEAAEGQTLVYVDITWREWEPVQGEYAVEQVREQNHLDRWRAEGKHVVLRFVCDEPGDEPHRDIPDWLYEQTGDGRAYDISYGKGYCPDYSNPVLIEAHARAIAALGEHFGQDTFVSYVELGSLGHWGEWHVDYAAGLPRLPSEEVRRQYITPYLTAFPNARLLMRRPFNDAAEYGLGLYNDMAGDEESTEEWLDWIQNGGEYAQAGEEDALSPMPSVWEYAPVGGEFTSNYTFDWMLRFHLEDTVRLIRQSHTTFLGPKCPHGASESGGANCQAGAEEVLRNMGYRLQVERTDIAVSRLTDRMEVTLSWVNDGVAPLYWDWPVYLYVLRGTDETLATIPVELSLTRLTGRQTIQTKTPIDISAWRDGGYTLCVGIVDPMTGQPAVYLAMDCPRVDTRSVLYRW